MRVNSLTYRRLPGYLVARVHQGLASFAPFRPAPGAKPPPFCTWQHVFAALRCKTTPFLHLAPCFCRPQVQIHPLFAPGNTFSPPSGANTPHFCTWHHVFAVLRCKYAPFLHLATRFCRPQVQIHPLFAPGNTFLPPSGANTPHFCTWQHVYSVLRCKYAPFLHLGAISYGLH